MRKEKNMNKINEKKKKNLTKVERALREQQRQWQKQQNEKLFDIIFGPAPEPKEPNAIEK